MAITFAAPLRVTFVSTWTTITWTVTAFVGGDPVKGREMLVLSELYTVMQAGYAAFRPGQPLNVGKAGSHRTLKQR